MKIYTIIGGIDGAGKSSFMGSLKYQRNDLGKIQETTLSGIRPLRMVKQAKAAGYFIRLLYVGIGSADEALKRIANRVSKGGHDIPKEDVLRRFEGRVEALAKVLAYCDEAVFFDNENGFVEVGEYRNGELISKGDYQPNWFLYLRAAIKQ